jgi:hypothetical protein
MSAFIAGAEKRTKIKRTHFTVIACKLVFEEFGAF